MNLIRTIPQYATEEWISLLFEPKSECGPRDFNPLTYPFPVEFRKDVLGGFLYVRYKSEIIGYGRIASIEHHSGDTVGVEGIAVRAGDMVILEAPLLPMHSPLPYPGLFRWKYVEADLH